MGDLSETQLAYLAGLIDGEGSLESQRQIQRRGITPRFSLRLAFVMSTEEPLKTVSKWLETPYKRFPPTTPRRSPRYRMSIPKEKACLVLKKCLPYLVLKHDQATLVLAIEETRKAASPDKRHNGKVGFQRVPEHAVKRMETLHTQLRSLKSNKRSSGYSLPLPPRK